MKHNLGFIFPVGVYAPTKMWEATKKIGFYYKLNSLELVSPPPPRHFDANTGTDRAGYKLGVDPHGSSTISSKFFPSELSKVQNIETWWVLGIKDQSCTTELGITVLERY